MDINSLDNSIRRVKDFPKPGILFYDVTGILENPKVYEDVTKKLSDVAKECKADIIAAIEARGFVFASSVAYESKLPLVLVRKEGKLPGKVVSESFKLEYGEDVLCVQDSDMYEGKRILVIDDLLATGGTVKASCNLMEKVGAEICGIAGVIGLEFLPYKKALSDYKITTLINFDSENIE